MTKVQAIQADHKGRVRQEISILRLLEWAFADECASIDFEDPGTLAQGYGRIGNAGRMADQGALGCRIDGGGWSYPDPDADLVASAVACLPEGCGGRRMAVQIAELARARAVPEAHAAGVKHCTPVSWHTNPHGRRAGEAVLGTVTDTSGRKPRRHEIRMCPVFFVPDAGQIAAARRNYLQWRLALLELQITFQIQNDLSRWSVSDRLPPKAPWQKVLAE